jgi:tetratricopeptide (TPR) repeat protein
VNANPTSAAEKNLRDTLKSDPAAWEARKQLAHHLYDKGSFQEAADVVWEADEIPSVDVELAFAARVLAKASPRKAIRLLTAVLEHNRGKAVQNLGLANALLHHGMVLQAARFYGAALEADPSLGNAELEHFILWTDDEETLWGDFKNRRPKLGELPWMKDPAEALKLTSRINLHTTPVKLPGLEPAAGEELNNELYQQTAEKGAKPTPPPAVTIPLDRVDPKYRLFDAELGAPGAPTVVKNASVVEEETVPAPAKVTPTLPTKAVAPNPTVTPPPRPAAAGTPGQAKPPVPAGPPTVRLKPALPPITPKST